MAPTSANPFPVVTSEYEALAVVSGRYSGSKSSASVVVRAFVIFELAWICLDTEEHQLERSLHRLEQRALAASARF